MVFYVIGREIGKVQGSRILESRWRGRSMVRYRRSIEHQLRCSGPEPGAVALDLFCGE